MDCDDEGAYAKHASAITGPNIKSANTDKPNRFMTQPLSRRGACCHYGAPPLLTTDALHHRFDARNVVASCYRFVLWLKPVRRYGFSPDAVVGAQPAAPQVRTALT